MPAQLVPFEISRFRELAGWVRAYFDHDGLEFNAAVAAGVEELLLHPEYGTAWGIHAGGSEVGYCVMTFGFDHEAGGRTGVVTDLYLIESARGQGLGSEVLRLLIQHANRLGLRQIELFVLNHNDGARRLYERHGFRSAPDREMLALPLTDPPQNP